MSDVSNNAEVFAPSPYIDKASKTDGGIGICDAILAEHEKMPGELFDIFAFCGGLNGVSFQRRMDMPPGLSGAIFWDAKRGFRIFVNRRDTEARQRFTAAHELAHYLLHREVLEDKGHLFDNKMLRAGLPAPIETEANQLAMEILVPYKALFERISDLGEKYSIDELADTFMVPYVTIVSRLGIPVHLED